MPADVPYPYRLQAARAVASSTSQFHPNPLLTIKYNITFTYVLANRNILLFRYQKSLEKLD